jgi:peptidase M28-like protein
MNRCFGAMLVALALVAAAGVARTQDEGDELVGPDREIAKIVNRVDPDAIQESVERLEGFGTRNSCSETQAKGRGVTPASDWILRRFSGIKGLNVVLDPFTHGNCPNSPTFNVLAWLPGTTHPERLIVIGGHYDSRTFDVFDVTSDAPGANDSGTQSAVVLELAKVLAHEQYPDTIVFVTFSGEEQGLFGSGALANKIAKHNVVPPELFPLPAFFDGATAVAMLNNDIVGGDNFVNGAAELGQFRLYSAGTPREIGSRAPDGTPDNTSPARGLMRFIGTWGTPYVPDLQIINKLRNDGPGRSSDQRSFTDNGIPAVRFMETLECSPSPIDNTGCELAANGLCVASNLSPLCALPDTDRRRTCVLGFGAPPCPVSGFPDALFAHQHSPLDIWQFVAATYSARIAKVMAATAASLARAPLSPTFNKDAAGNFVVPTVDAGGAVTVSWTAPIGDAIDHYVIAARSTAENFYRVRVSVSGSATSATITPAQLGMNAGDKFFISVAAVGSGGHESLFAYPEFRCDGPACSVPANALNVTAAM